MCHRYIKGLEFKSRVPLNKASTTCTKNDSSGLQSICFSANNFSSISFNNSGLGSDLTNSQLKAHVSIPWGKYGKEAKTEIHKCTYFASTLFLSEIIYRHALIQFSRIQGSNWGMGMNPLHPIHGDKHEMLLRIMVQKYIKEEESIPVTSWMPQRLNPPSAPDFYHTQSHFAHLYRSKFTFSQSNSLCSASHIFGERGANMSKPPSL